MPKPRPLISFDWAVKKLLRSKANFRILEGFLSELLKCQLKIVEIIDGESNRAHENDRSNRTDVLAKLTTGEIVIIEVQVNTEEDYFSRMLYGVSKAIVEHIEKGEAYLQVKKVYSVNIVYFDLGVGSDYVYLGTTSFTGIHNHDRLSLSSEQKQLYQRECIEHIHPEYYLIKVNEFNEIAKNTLDEWIYFLKTDTIKDDFKAQGLAEAKEKLDYLKLPETERREYDNYLENLGYHRSMLGSSYRMGEIRGKIEGKAEGLVEGLAEGKAEGKEEGKMEAKKASVLKMHNKNLSAEVIADFVDLNIDAIKAIIAENYR